MKSNIPDLPPPTPIPLLRSLQFQPLEVLLLGVGLWLLLGVFGSFDRIAAQAGHRADVVYWLAALLALPSLASHVALRRRNWRSGGSYRLLQALERPALTFLAGWVYPLAWAGLGGMVAWTFGRQAEGLLQRWTTYAWGPLPLLAGFLLLIGLLNAFGRAPFWGLVVRFSALTGLGLVVLALALGRGVAGFPPAIEQVAVPSRSLFRAVASLALAALAIELMAERHGPRRLLAGIVAGNSVVPALAGAVALIGARVVPGGAQLAVLAEIVLPGWGSVLTAAAGLLLMLLVWHALSIMMLRQLQLLGADGVLPGWMVKPSRRKGHPARLSLLQTALALVGALSGWAVAADQAPAALGDLAAAAFLLLQLGVNLAAIPRANKRSTTRGAWFPVRSMVALSGAAISFLLLLALPTWTRALLILWAGLGAAAFWRGGRQRMHAIQLGVTVFQDRSSERQADSDYPVLIPIANPETASGLVRIGAAMARERGGHVVLLQVIQVAEHLPLDSGRAEARRRLDLLERLLGEAEQAGAAAQGLTRLSRSIIQGILDTVAEESVHLVVMGSNIRPQIGSAGFGDVVDQVLEGASCEVAVVRGEVGERLGEVVVPVAEEHEGLQAARLALGLAQQQAGRVTLLHVARQVQGEAARAAGEALLARLQSALGDDGRLSSKLVTAGSPLEGILRGSEQADLVVVGASSQNLLDAGPFGRLPLQLVQRSDVPLMLVRGQTALPTYVARRAWRSLADVFPTLDLEEQMGVYRRMREAVRPNINYFVLIALSAVIASLGLLLNSPAVVIGAMLVAPLMTPIVAAAIGITVGDTRVLRDSLTATLQGMLAAIFIAILMTLLVPGAETTPEVLARANPTLIDLIVALASGMAGAYAIARKEVGEALPGVAIAAALLPPLASVGVGIALGQAAVAGGALLLFTTNLIAIVFASALVFLLLGVRPPRVEEREQRLRQGLVISIVSLLLVSLPLGLFLLRSVQRDRLEGRAHTMVEQRVKQWGAIEIVDFNLEQRGGKIAVQGTLYTEQPIEPSQVLALQSELGQALGLPVSLEIMVVQGSLLQATYP